METFTVGIGFGVVLSFFFSRIIKRGNDKTTHEKITKFIRHIEIYGGINREFEIIHREALSVGGLSDYQIILLNRLYMEKYLKRERD